MSKPCLSHYWNLSLWTCVILKWVGLSLLVWKSPTDVPIVAHLSQPSPSILTAKAVVQRPQSRAGGRFPTASLPTMKFIHSNIDLPYYQEKYQQPQICRWYHSNGRQGRKTKEPLDENERREWKSWLETQHSKKLRSWYLVPSLHCKYKGKKWKQGQTLFSWAPKSLQMVTVAMKFKNAWSFEGKPWQT